MSKYPDHKYRVVLPNKIGINRGRAWLDTVINPSIGTLRYALADGHYTQIDRVYVQIAISFNRSPKFVEIAYSTGMIHILFDKKYIGNVEDMYSEIPYFYEIEDTFLTALKRHRAKANELYHDFVLPVECYLDYLVQLRNGISRKFDIPYISNQIGIFP